MKKYTLLPMLVFVISGCGGGSSGGVGSVLNDGGSSGLKAYLITGGIDDWFCDVQGVSGTFYYEFFNNNLGVGEYNSDGSVGFNYTVIGTNTVRFQFPADGSEDEWTVTRLDNVNFRALSINGAEYECERV